MLRKPDIHKQKNEIIPISHMIYKSQLKIDKDLNLRLQPTRENIREKLLDPGLPMNCFDITLIAKINKWECSKPNSFYTAKDAISTVKKKTTYKMRKNICRLYLMRS